MPATENTDTLAVHEHELGEQHLAGAMALSRAANWNQNEADWRMMLRLGKGFGLSAADGSLVASIVVLPYGDEFAWMSMVLVSPQHRRLGYASRMLRRALAYLQSRGLAAVLDARHAVEIGTGTGVSGIWLLRGMREDGVLTSVDIEAENQRQAREAFAAEGVPASRTRLITGRALEVLPRLADASYDLVLADGAKEEYPDYVEEAARLLVDQWGFTMEDAFIFLSVACDVGIAQSCHPCPGSVIARVRVPKLDACPTPFRVV